MKGFDEWLHFNDGDRYEGLREEFFEGGGEPGNFLDWAEAKYAAGLKVEAERTAAQPPSKYPSVGLLINVDHFSGELYSYREASEELATACDQIEQVKSEGFSPEVRERVQRHFDGALERRDKSAQYLAELVSALVKATDPRSK